MSVEDIVRFLQDWFAQAPSADFNGNGEISVQDIFELLECWFGMC